MENDHIKHILEQLESGQLTASDAYDQLKLAPFEDLGYAKVDHHREVRQGAPEVIYGASKTKEQMEGIINSLLSHCKENILITRLSTESAAYLSERFDLFYAELSKIELLSKANAIIAVAGMEGALASVIGGLTDCPVIGVPTSVGYGASFGGISALLSMLNSCASGVSVVNIDNGFGAGYLASMINHQAAPKTDDRPSS